MRSFLKGFQIPGNLIRRLVPYRSSQFRCHATGSSNYRRSVNQLLEATKPPHSNSWSSYTVPAALLVIAGGAMFVHYNDKRRAIPKGSYIGIDNQRNSVQGPAIGGPFSLIDMDGHPFTERNLKGSWTLIYFGYTSSPDIVPEEVKKMAKTVDILESEQNLKVKPVFISIDPERDSPAQLRAYLTEFDPRIIGLTGSVAAIRQTAREYRVYFKKIDENGEDYLIESSHLMYLMNPNMELVKCFGVEYGVEQLCEGIIEELKGVPS